MLPDAQSPLYEIGADLILPTPAAPTDRNATHGEKDRGQDRGTKYTGRLHLSEGYICFSTQQSSFSQTASITSSSSFMGQTQGAGPSGNGFTLPLCSIRRVERLNSQSHQFSLALTTWNGTTLRNAKDSTSLTQRIIVQLVGSRQSCERFCDGLKKGLRGAMKDLESLRGVVSECYSEYLLSEERNNTKALKDTEGGGPEPPDAGLGMVFRYPGDPRKLRDRSKMRLWEKYLRGMSVSNSA